MQASLASTYNTVKHPLPGSGVTGEHTSLIQVSDAAKWRCRTHDPGGTWGGLQPLRILPIGCSRSSGNQEPAVMEGASRAQSGGIGTSRAVRADALVGQVGRDQGGGR